MKKGWIIVIAIAAAMGIWFARGYNSLVKQDEAVKTAWAQVENQYQRRSDLIPNLVNTVKGYAEHESQTLESVVAARARATQVTVDPEALTAESMQQYQAAQGELTAALGRLLMIQEASAGPARGNGEPHRYRAEPLQRGGARLQYADPPLPDQHSGRSLRL